MTSIELREQINEETKTLESFKEDYKNLKKEIGELEKEIQYFSKY